MGDGVGALDGCAVGLGVGSGVGEGIGVGEGVGMTVVGLEGTAVVGLGVGAGDGLNTNSPTVTRRYDSNCQFCASACMAMDPRECVSNRSIVSRSVCA